MPELSIASKAEFLASLDRLTREEVTLPHDDMMNAIQSVPSDDFTASDLNKMIDFATEQVGRWQARWLFSPAYAPDANAETESGAWNSLWEGLLKLLVDMHPEVETLLRQKSDILITARQTELKVQHDSRSGSARFYSLMMSLCARALNTLGFKSAARRLMGRALYPAGTVGRGRL